MQTPMQIAPRDRNYDNKALPPGVVMYTDFTLPVLAEGSRFARVGIPRTDTCVFYGILFTRYHEDYLAAPNKAALARSLEDTFLDSVRVPRGDCSAYTAGGLLDRIAASIEANVLMVDPGVSITGTSLDLPRAVMLYIAEDGVFEPLIQVLPDGSMQMMFVR